MSGFVGVVHLDGRPVDAAALRRWTAALAFRGPDGEGCWAEGGVGLGHALLAADGAARGGAQPAAQGGWLWLVADLRLDGRAELVRRLGDPALARAGDAALVLAAWDLWGEGCVERLCGDFAFALWDARARRLFCARDPLGVKPFYYAETPGAFLFSNTLTALRRHPAVSSRLDDRAVGDFLLFGGNQDLTTTTFADVRRLPPASTLTVVPPAGAGAPRRYWRLQPASGGRTAPAEVVEGFRELLRQAVADRLGAGAVAVSLSGGLDSTAVAAAARAELAAQGRGDDLWAYTLVYRRLIPDREGDFAALVGERLALPIDFVAVDDHRRFAGWEPGRLPSPEPVSEGLWALSQDVYRRLTGRGRVLLTGFGGDPLLLHPPAYFWRQLRRGRLGRAAAYLRATQWLRPHLPPLGVRTRWLAWRFRRAGEGAAVPPWVAPDFARRADLAGRWREVTAPAPAKDRAGAVAQTLADPAWAQMFESDDPGFSGFPVEHRHPFFDRRLLEHTLTLPEVPWFVDKRLLREAVRGELPEAVRLRPKAPLAGAPEHPFDRDLAAELRGPWFARAAILEYLKVDEIADYVSGAGRERRLVQGAAPPSGGDLLLRALSLAYWLAGVFADVEGA